MLDDKQGIKKQHKPWELKKLSTSLYLTDSEENKIIPAVSQKRLHRFGKKMFSKILTIFFTGYLGEIDAINEVMVIITWLLKHAENSRL